MTDSKPKNIWKILFGVSLALNLLIVGAVGGVLVRKAQMPIASHIAPGVLYIKAMDFENKRALRQTILRNNDDKEMVTNQNHASFTSAVRLLKSHPFDKEVFENVLIEHANRSISRQNSVRNTLVSHISNMTKKDRLIYAQRLEELVDRRHSLSK